MQESKVKDCFRTILFPILYFRRRYNNYKQIHLGETNPKVLAEKLYYNCMHQQLDWQHPQDLNAKIQWLKFYGDTTLWPLCADKYRVREFIQERGLDNILVKLYGKWDKAEDIEWDKLPDQFVMKVNNGSGDVLICQDKSKLNKKEVVKKFNQLLGLKFWYKFAEPHYSKIPPCIIAEELLVNDYPEYSSSLVDYKIWAFDGKPECIYVCANRSKGTMQSSMYDLEWNLIEGATAGPHKDDKVLLPKPKHLDEMLRCASILSRGFPEMRVDLYESSNKVYFGELTLSGKGGYMDSISREMLYYLGSKTILPTDK